MMSIRKTSFFTIMLAALALILRAPAPAMAQEQYSDDPPTRVARLNFVQGTVSFQPAGGGDNDWVAAEMNRPLTTGDQLWSDADGQVEMHVGSTAVRMDHNTGISYLNLSDNIVQLQVSAGSVVVRLRQLDPNDAFEIDAPNLAFSLLQPGTYQVDVDPDRDVTVVTVVSGQGQVTGGGRSWNITPDQQATFSGTDTLDYNLEDADSLQQTAFQQWSLQRDSLEDHAPPDPYVSPETTGYEDLNTYGTWSPQPDYGPVWFPTGIEVGWAPYRMGHWVFIAPWGWTWVDAEPWGFAPFHYGRWAVFGGRWGWVPGPVVVGVRPVYAPALVAWVGGTPGFSFSVGFGGGGGIGWFALGPRDVFMPTYHVSEAYVTRINVTNTFVDRNTVVDVYHNNARNVTYVNQHVEGGVTVVSHDTFVSGGVVSRNVVNVSARDVASAPVNRAGPQAEPTRASMVGAARPATVRPPAAVVNRTAVAVHTPPARPQVFHGNGAANGAPNGSPIEGRGGGQYRSPAQPENQPANRNVNGPGGNPPNPPAANEPARTPNGPAENAAPTNDNRDNDRNVPPNTPNVRPAPPVRQATPQEQQSDAQKQQDWQNKHQQVHQNDKPSGGNKNNGGKKDDKPPRS